MSSVPESPEGKEPAERPDDSPPKAEYFALGCGCLLTILIFGGAIMLGISRG